MHNQLGIGNEIQQLINDVRKARLVLQKFQGNTMHLLCALVYFTIRVEVIMKMLFG